MPPEALKPFWSVPGIAELYQGDVLSVLRRLPSRSVHMIVTSPPYWGLRDYGTGTWEGGDTGCDHVMKTGSVYGTREGWRDGWSEIDKKVAYAKVCGKCGARRIDHQLGSETSPDCLGWARGVNCAEQDWANGCHVCRMVLVCRELRRVLRDDGTFWLNYGDSYAGSWGNYGGQNRGKGTQRSIVTGSQAVNPAYAGKEKWRPPTAGSFGLPSGNLVGVPWRVALALQADGWILRSDIPWVKRSAMPESVQNRPAKALEYVFLFAKKSGYYFDMEAVRKAAKYPEDKRKPYAPGQVDARGNGHDRGGGTVQDRDSTSRNFRNADLWFQSVEPYGLVGVGDELVGIDVTSQGYTGAHYATFPPKLIEPMILAGTSAKGACGKCGCPWRRAVEQRGGERVEQRGERDRSMQRNRNGITGSLDGVPKENVTLGWGPGCECFGKQVRERTIGRGRGKGTDNSAVEHGGVKGPPGGQQPQSDQRGEKVVERTIVHYESSLPLEDHPVVPCTVLDPFVGSGTTCMVAVQHGRRGIGIDLSEKYLKENAIPRIGEVIPKAEPVRHEPTVFDIVEDQP